MGVTPPKPKRKKYDSKYQTKWEVDFPWIGKSNSSGTACCKVCSRRISVSHGGKHDIIRHSQTSVHIKNYKQSLREESPRPVPVQLYAVDTCKIESTDDSTSTAGNICPIVVKTETHSPSTSPVQSPVQLNYSLERVQPFSQQAPPQSGDGMDLSAVVDKLHEFAPPSLAGDWDNVGLLVEPSGPHKVRTLFLTNDLTPPVLEEAISKRVDMILSYHPPLFRPLKRLTQASWKERIIIKCIENRIAVHSPHTTYDALEGGVNDWLLEAFNWSDSKPIEQTSMPPKKYKKKRVFTIPSSLAQSFKDRLNRIDDVLVTSSAIDDNLVQISLLCNPEHSSVVMDVIEEDMSAVQSIESYDLQKVAWPGYGMGRIGTLDSPINLEEAIHRVRSHLDLENVRVAACKNSRDIDKVAVCAGSGSGLLGSVVGKASLFVTGELSHHDVLHAVHSGTSVILCDHSNTERGYLHVLKATLTNLFDKTVNVIVSEVDKDPLSVV